MTTNSSDSDREQAPQQDEMSAAAPADALRKANRKLVWQLSIFALGFLGFGFALVPLYNVLCDVTGFGSRENLTQASAPGAAQASEPPREITVDFMLAMPTVGEWEFHPVVSSLIVRTGQLTTAKFIAKNLLAQPATGQAVPSIAPHDAALYFHKTECFCFIPQHFDAMQERELTVRFVVDTHLPEDEDHITLAYSMYGVEVQKVASAK